jgi:23S rRNA (uracil1939-C5)-methyltransferase
MTKQVVRIAARGDGVTASGRHAPFGVPGDTLLDDGTIARGPHHQQPPCRHFPECGGCQLQHVDDDAYRDYLVSRVVTALAQHGLATEIRDPHLSPPRTRRRASLRALKVGEGAVIGFNAAKSNRIVDMRECHILRPELFDLIAPLRSLLAGLLPQRRTAEVQLALVDQGVDLLLKGVEPEGYEAMEGLTSFCESNRLARLSVDQGLGPETLYEPFPATPRRWCSRTARTSRPG